MIKRAQPNTALIDLDGTLVDTNYHHTLAWYRAFRDNEIILPVWRLHRAIGMGGDKLVQAVAGKTVEATKGEAVRKAHSSHYRGLISETSVLAGATQLLAHLHIAGWRTILASSAAEEDIQHYLNMLDARDLVDGWTGAADVSESKPSPDILQSALQEAGADPTDAVMIGDSTWDIEAAKQLGIPTVCVLTGGFSAQELLDAGASQVFESLTALRKSLDVETTKSAWTNP